MWTISIHLNLYELCIDIWLLSIHLYLSLKVGACIVNERNRIVGTGYNGMPDRIKDEDLPWVKDQDKLKDKHVYGKDTLSSI